MGPWWRSKSGAFPELQGNHRGSSTALFISPVRNESWDTTMLTVGIIDMYEAKVIPIVSSPRLNL